MAALALNKRWACLNFSLRVNKKKVILTELIKALRSDFFSVYLGRCCKWAFPVV